MFFSLLYQITNVFGVMDSVPEKNFSVAMKLFKSTCLVKGETELNFKIKDIIVQRTHMKLGS